MAALTSPHILEYPYQRSTGPIVGAFLTALRDGRVVGVRARDGRVLVPPQEYDPVTSETLDEIVDVGSSGTVVSWAWNPRPREGQPLASAGAWALVRLDGADTPLLHALDVRSPADAEIGMRVRIRWAEERVGSIADIACFEPLPSPTPQAAARTPGARTPGARTPGARTPGARTPGARTPGARIQRSSDSSPMGHESEDAARRAPADGRPDSNADAQRHVFESGRSAGGDPGAAGDLAAGDPVTPGSEQSVTSVATPIRLEYTYTAGPSSEAFLRGTQERRLLGRRCSECAKVYMPPRGVCSMCGAPFTDEIVEVGPNGTVTTFAIVNVNFASREIDLPYAAVEVLFDGADITSQFLIQGASHDEVRMGMRVRAVWKQGELEPTLSNVSHVEPIDEPDAAFETFEGYV